MLFRLGQHEANTLEFAVRTKKKISSRSVLLVTFFLGCSTPATEYPLHFGDSVQSDASTDGDSVELGGTTDGNLSNDCGANPDEHQSEMVGAALDAPESDVQDVQDVAPPTDATNLAWVDQCIVAGSTAATSGSPGPLPDACSPSNCNICGPYSKCTCEGDGSTPCAWSAAPELNLKRANATGVIAEDGKLYVFGGENMPGNGLPAPTPDPVKQPGLLVNADVFDHLTQTWTLSPPAPIYPSLYNMHLPSVWGAGRLWVASANAFLDPNEPKVQLPWGPNYADYAAYDPSSQTWSALSTQGSPGGCGMWDAMAWANGRLYVVGCQGLPGAPSVPPSSYDPSTDAWTPLPTLPAPGTDALVGVHPVAREVSQHVVWVTMPATVKGNLIPPYLVDFNTKSEKWLVNPLPLCLTQSGFVIQEALTIDDGYFAWSANSNKVKQNEIWIWRPEPQIGESVPIPKWLDVANDRYLAWTGHEVVVASLDYGKTNSAMYDPVKKQWRQLPRLGAGPIRATPVTLFSDQRLFLIGGELVLGPTPATASVDSLFIPAFQETP